DSVEVAERQAGEEAVRSDEDALVAAAKTKASGLAARFGLTAREEEIAALLLEGRTRPYISDELVVSLHTVHAHVRNIYNKCEVHSVQELIDISQSK
ncbi:MAG: helix-turn-helix transcriptional regulator, partial [Eggerthellaceae bacterium]|nr:helix-turn-helix transcriptional regulator [Eggerthellaceae bacterium]